MTEIISHPWFSRRVPEYYRWYPRDLSRSELFGQLQPVNGIYIHIPFCDEICSFCPYNTKAVSRRTEIDTYVSYLMRELEIYASKLELSTLDFIYFGGGTPSTLSAKNISDLLDKISRQFALHDGTEISIEAHPNDIVPARLAEFSVLGITRISCGVQSFSAQTLSGLNCHHDARTSLNVAEFLSSSSLKTGIDLLYRCENQTIGQVVEDLDVFSRFEMGHLSLYSLFLTDSSRQASAIDEAEMAVVASDYLSAKGFHHYASCASGGYDFAKTGEQGRYERDHWQAPQASYLGIGVGAFGFVSNAVTINLHNLKAYTMALDDGRLPILSATHTTATELRHRYFSLGVKTIRVELTPYRSIFHTEPSEDFGQEFSQLVDLGLVTVGHDALELTSVGRHFVDQVSEVFLSSGQRLIEHPETEDLRRFERQLMKSKKTLAGAA